MISMSYVNGTSPVVEATDEHNIFESTFSKMYAETNMFAESVREEIEQYLFEKEITGTDTEKEQKLSEDQKNAFEKIGETIRKAFEELVKMITHFITSIKESSFKRKTDLEKIDAYSKKVSKEESDKILEALSKGDIDISDLKSIEEIHKAYMEFLDQASNPNVDPNTLKGKVEIFKEKLKNIDKSAAMKTVGAVAATTGAISGVFALREHMLKATGLQNKHLNDVHAANKRTNEILGILSKNGIDDWANLSRQKQIAICNELYTGSIEKHQDLFLKKWKLCDDTIANVLKQVSQMDSKKFSAKESVIEEGFLGNNSKRLNNIYNMATQKAVDDINAEKDQKQKEDDEAKARKIQMNQNALAKSLADKEAAESRARQNKANADLAEKKKKDYKRKKKYDALWDEYNNREKWNKNVADREAAENRKFKSENELEASSYYLDKAKYNTGHSPKNNK